MPLGTDLDPLSVVSNHAALRWLERTRGVDLGHGFGKLTREQERTLLWKLCADLKTTPPAIKTAMMTPDVRAAFAAGARKFVAATYVLVFRGEKITTVLEPFMRSQRKPKKARRG